MIQNKIKNKNCTAKGKGANRKIMPSMEARTLVKGDLRELTLLTLPQPHDLVTKDHRAEIRGCMI